jgi:hypothetical protein
MSRPAPPAWSGGRYPASPGAIHEFDDTNGRGRAGFDTKGVDNGLDMFFDGPAADAHNDGDFLVAFSFRDPERDDRLTEGQSGLDEALFAAADALVEERRGAAAVEANAAHPAINVPAKNRRHARVFHFQELEEVAAGIFREAFDLRLEKHAGATPWGLGRSWFLKFQTDLRRRPAAQNAPAASSTSIAAEGSGTLATRKPLR